MTPLEDRNLHAKCALHKDNCLPTPSMHPPDSRVFNELQLGKLFVSDFSTGRMFLLPSPAARVVYCVRWVGRHCSHVLMYVPSCHVHGMLTQLLASPACSSRLVVTVAVCLVAYTPYALTLFSPGILVPLAAVCACARAPVPAGQQRTGCIPHRLPPPSRWEVTDGWTPACMFLVAGAPSREHH